MAANDYTECKQILGSMRAATIVLRELPATESKGEIRQIESADDKAA